MTKGLTNEEHIAQIREAAKGMQSMLDHSMAELLFAGKLINQAEIADLTVEMIVRKHHEVLTTLMAEMHSKRTESIRALYELANNMEKAQPSPE